MKYEITHIQLFDYIERQQTSEDFDFEIVYSYSANVIINDNFVVQIHGNETECVFDGIADPIDAFWNNEANQEHALKTIDDDYLESELEKNGFENNIGWLGDCPLTEVMMPENAKYRK